MTKRSRDTFYDPLVDIATIRDARVTFYRSMGKTVSAHAARRVIVARVVIGGAPVIVKVALSKDAYAKLMAALDDVPCVEEGA